jgi:TonB family protein
MNTLPRLDFDAPSWAFELVTHLWQSTVVAGLILLVIVLGRKLCARTRLALGWIAIVKFAVPSAWLASLVLPAGDASGRWLESNVFIFPLQRLAEPSADVPITGEISVALFFVAIWVVGTLALLGGWVARAKRARRRILAESTPASEVIAVRVKQAASRVGLRAVPRIAMVEAEHAPGVAGVLAPVLILPRGLDAMLSPAELDAILVHECVHLRRRDNFWNAVRASFVAVMWFNPVVWLLNRAVGIEMEKSCDERVLEVTGDADAYANGIVGCVRYALGVGASGVSSATTPPVVGRIHAILAHSSRRERAMVRRVLLSAAIAMVALSGQMGSIAAESTKPAPTPAQAPVPTPVQASPAAADATGSTPAQPARHKIGTVTITFVGSSSVTEEAVRANLTVRAGGEIDELILDRDIRSIYRMGVFKTVEAKYTPNPTGGYNLEFVLTPKPPTADAATSDRRVKLEQNSQAVAERNERLKRLQPEVLSIFDPPTPPRLPPNSKEMDAVKQRIAAADAAAEAAAKAAAEAASARAFQEQLSAAIGRENITRQSGVQSVGSQGGKVAYTIQELDRAPVPRLQGRPQYPFEMRRAGIGGEVVLGVVVSDAGDVINTHVLSSTRPEFEQAAINSVSRWKFRPGMKNGVAVNSYLTVPVGFTINER